jgi:hypothetical protein
VFRQLFVMTRLVAVCSDAAVAEAGQDSSEFVPDRAMFSATRSGENGTNSETARGAEIVVALLVSMAQAVN